MYGMMAPTGYGGTPYTPQYGNQPNQQQPGGVVRRPPPNLWPFGQPRATPDVPPQRQPQQQQRRPGAPGGNMAALGMGMLFPGQQNAGMYGALAPNINWWQQQQQQTPQQPMDWSWLWGGGQQGSTS